MFILDFDFFLDLQITPKFLRWHSHFLRRDLPLIGLVHFNPPFTILNLQLFHHSVLILPSSLPEVSPDAPSKLPKEQLDSL